MTKEQLLELMCISKSEGGLNQIQEIGFKKKFPILYEDFCHVQFPSEFTFKQKMFHYLHNDYCVEIGKCKVCGKRAAFISIKRGYHIYCSNSCAQGDVDNVRKRKATCAEKYGNSNYNNRAKSKKTCIEKYGVENVQQIDGINEKSVKTKHDLYGESCKQISDKTKQTKRERYGDEKYNNKEKAKTTCMEKYGVSNASMTNEVKEKIRNAFYEKYGVSHPMKSDDVLRKVKNTNIEKYGVEWCCMRKEARLGYSNDSTPNKAVEKILQSNGIHYEREFSLDGFIYDFKIGDVLLEVNPTPTHNSLFGIFNKRPLDKGYHIRKTVSANKNGFRCIHIWDWDDLEKVVSMLNPKSIVYARNLDVCEIDVSDATKFMSKYHLQGSCKGCLLNIALCIDGNLVMVMSIGKPRYNNAYEWEILRLCTAEGYGVVGGAEKIFAFFKEKYNPKSVISYCDFSKFNGSVYRKLDFAEKTVNPSLHWYNTKTHLHITDNLLRQRGFDQLFKTNYGKGASNYELIVKSGFLPVWDCGQITFTWNCEQKS